MKQYFKQLRISRTTIPVLAIVLIGLLYASCHKIDSFQSVNEYLQDATFFKRNDTLSGQFAKINGNLTDESLLNKLIDEFKTYDKQKQIAEKIKTKYGKPQWDISIVLKNANGYRTIATPIVNTQNEVTAVGLFYQKSPTVFDYKIVNRLTQQKHLPEYGDKEATVFTKASLIGLFQVADKNLANATLLKKMNSDVATNANTTLSYNISWICWSYVWSYIQPNGTWGVGVTSTQCSYTIIFGLDYMPKTDDDGSSDGRGGFGGNDGTTTNNSPLIVKVDSVNPIITSPCMDSAFQKISAARLKNEITKMYNETFVGTGKKFNLTVWESSFIPNGYISQSNVASGHPDTWEVYLNGMYADTLTQELWASVIMHEIIHGFIVKNDLGFNMNATLEDSHKLMLSNWVLQVQDLLTNIFGIDSADALAISLEGFDDVLKNKVGGQFKADMKAWMEATYGVDAVTAQALAHKYYTGERGTKCH